jgi:thiol-disulfide isomerase/thioredoxin
MSEERRKKQEQREKQGQPRELPWRAAGIVLLVIVVAGGVYYLATRHHAGRLDSFAQCLTGKGVKMYGAYWCPHCQEQKELFGSSFDFAPYVECGVEGSRAEQPVCVAANIKNFPTWVFPDGTRVEGKVQIAALGEKTGCPLP